jgi:uncharacterized radical SAM superfamily protein
VVPDVVMVDESSTFASDACTLPIVLVDIVTDSGLVHDVQKLAKAVLDEVRRLKTDEAKESQW